MCLVALNWDPEADLPLTLIANRDEFRARPTMPMHWWPDQSVDMLAGKDLQAGGTWFAIDRAGRFALVTNIRPGYVGKSATLSRGALPVGFIQSGGDIAAFHAQIVDDIPQYGGFNLLLGDLEQLFWFSSDRPEGCQLKPGVHVLSNDALNTPWPKVELAREQMRASIEHFRSGEIDLDVLASTSPFPDEELPQTGVSADWESKLSAQTIVGSDYGTRSRCWLRVTRQRQVSLTEAQLTEAAELHAQLHFNWQA